MRGREAWGLGGLWLLLLSLVSFGLVFPVGTMLCTMDSATAVSLFASASFQKAVTRSVVSASVATAMALTLGAVFAWSVTRTRMGGKNFFRFILTLPMLVPSVSHGMGFLILLGANGILTRAFALDFQIYGFAGIVLGGVMYGFPVAFLMLADVLQYEERAQYDVAEVLGISKWHQFRDITLPYLAKPLISVILATFTVIVTDYGVPIMVGGNYVTLPLLMYQEVIGLLDFGKGSVIGLCLLIPALLAFCLDVIFQEKGKPGTLSGGHIQEKNPRRDGLATLFCVGGMVFVLLPVLAFLLVSVMSKYPQDTTLTLAHIQKTIQMKGLTYLANSVGMAVAVAVLGTAVGFVGAYLTARVRGKLAGVFHLAMLLSLAVPGIVLGLSYGMVYPGTFLYGTMAILVLVNLIHFFASPYLMAYHSFQKINHNLEGVAMTLGISRFALVKDVLLPQMKGTIWEMFSYLFVNSMITISAVAFLTTTKTMPVSVMITQFQATFLLECSAFVSLMILSVNVLAKCLFGWLGQEKERG